MITTYLLRCQRLVTLRLAALIVSSANLTAIEILEPHYSHNTRGLKDECVAISKSMALEKLGISVNPRELVKNRISKGLGREFEATSETLPHTLKREISSHVLLNCSSKVNADILHDLTRRGALVLSLSTKLLLGDRSGKATPDHAVHIREIVRKRGVDYMVVVNC